jgi:hypothetical protein
MIMEQDRDIHRLYEILGSLSDRILSFKCEILTLKEELKEKELMIDLYANELAEKDEKIKWLGQKAV